MLAEELLHENKRLLESVSQRKRDVLHRKRLALMEKLLEDAQHEDVNLIRDILKGFDLTGPLLKEMSLRRSSDQPQSLVRN